MTGVQTANVAEPGLELKQAWRALGREAGGSRSGISPPDAHPVLSLGLCTSLSPPLSSLLPALLRQLAPKLLCPPDTQGLES